MKVVNGSRCIMEVPRFFTGLLLIVQRTCHLICEIVFVIVLRTCHVLNMNQYLANDFCH